LLREVGGFDLGYKNSVGNTAVHLVVKSGQPSLLKLMFVQDLERAELYLGSGTAEDLRGVLNEQALRTLVVQNTKLQSPLLLAVHLGNYEVFRFLLELHYVHDQTLAAQKTLPVVVGQRDHKRETCLVKAARSKQLEMVYSLLHLGNDVITYQVLCDTDSQQRNILHYAAINQQRDLIEILVRLDADKNQLRLQCDTKKKTPQQYDQSGSYAESFQTVWDYAKEGNLRKLRLCIETGKFTPSDQTPWLKNTPLHLAVRNQQLDVIKCLVFDYEADPQLENSAGKSALALAQAIKDEATRNTIVGLLNKIHTTTKIEKNLDAKREREAIRCRNREEIERMRQELKDKIAQKGIDIA